MIAAVLTLVWVGMVLTFAFWGYSFAAPRMQVGQDEPEPFFFSRLPEGSPARGKELLERIEMAASAVEKSGASIGSAKSAELAKFHGVFPEALRAYFKELDKNRSLFDVQIALPSQSEDDECEASPEPWNVYSKRKQLEKFGTLWEEHDRIIVEGPNQTPIEVSIEVCGSSKVRFACFSQCEVTEYILTIAAVRWTMIRGYAIKNTEFQIRRTQFASSKSELPVLEVLLDDPQEREDYKLQSGPKLSEPKLTKGGSAISASNHQMATDKKNQKLLKLCSEVDPVDFDRWPDMWFLDIHQMEHCAKFYYDEFSDRVIIAVEKDEDLNVLANAMMKWKDRFNMVLKFATLYEDVNKDAASILGTNYRGVLCTVSPRKGG